MSFEIREHEVLAIIGPNGAGKTSMLNCINGFYHPQEGTITYQGVAPADAVKPYEAAKSGIARTFQNVALFRRHERARQHHDRPHPENAGRDCGPSGVDGDGGGKGGFLATAAKLR